MTTESFIALRYLWNTRRTRFLNIITLISILGITIGVAALICVQSIMDGLQNKMRAAILGAKTHISVEYSDGFLQNYDSLREKLLKHGEISGVTPFITRDVMVSASDETSGAVINGIDAKTVGSATLFPSQIIKGSLECLVSPESCPELAKKRLSAQELMGEGENGEAIYSGIAIGSELAKYYGLDIGDKFKVISPVGGGVGPAGPLPFIKTFQVAAIFFSALYEYDLSYAYIALDDAKKLFATEGGVDKLGIKLKDMYQVDFVEKIIKSELGPKYVVQNWRDMNKQLFSALEMEKVVWFLILGFIVVVAAFNVISALTLLVTGKKPEIAVLRAMGFTANSIMKIFMIDGFIIGVLGTISGALLGLVASVSLDDLAITAAQDVYYIDKIPVDMSLSTFIITIFGSLILTVVAAIYPGKKAAALAPAEALRNE